MFCLLLFVVFVFFFFKQKTAYEMRISDWSSDVCSSDLAERERMYDEYFNRIGEIVNGTVKRVEYGNVIVDLGRGEAIIRRDELIPREMFRYGDRKSVV